ncbi:hypothetical protein [Mucilaginibacter pocheonensis]|uniref:ABC-type antimicrobial peptide transport system permease subunit n=1 Tax=Mucilaginibacter pocheonensis TaxID=398050 RepID=A0ABU1T6R4_9SPHI|nr:hypothetical protein [Mucilaginibacter pocheonensis]MDR6940984.1 ABC-type antimicrobial peptide transport system permease subunit [Mucilaginibacter pocheonensis]
MNWNLILKLSLFGLAMGIATAFFIPSNVEGVLWPIIFIICAFIIAKNCTGMYFANGFCLSLLNCVWIIAAHLIFFNSYMESHAKEAGMYNNNPYHISPQIAMVIIGFIIGILSGLVQGLFAFIASKIVAPNRIIPFQD